MDQQDYGEFDEEEEQRVKLYDLVRSKREWQDNGTDEIDNPPVARLLYAAEINEGMNQDAKFPIEERIKQRIQDIESEGNESNFEYQIYGFLLVKSNCIIHFLEGDSNIINQKFVKDFLYEEFKQEKSIFISINIICMNEENPHRLYDKFHCPSSSAGQPGIQLSSEIDRSEEQIADRSFEIYNQFCEVGKKHGDKKTREKQTKRLENIIQLSNDDLSMLVKSKDYYMTITDYYDMYLEDLKIQLDSEVVFPYTPSLIQNLEYSERGYYPEVKL